MDNFVLPPVINLILGPLLIAFGVFRFYLGRRALNPEWRAGKKGLSGLSPRMHFIFALLYVAAGGLLLYMAVRQLLA